MKDEKKPMIEALTDDDLDDVNGGITITNYLLAGQNLTRDLAKKPGVTGMTGIAKNRMTQNGENLIGVDDLRDKNDFFSQDEIKTC